MSLDVRSWGKTVAKTNSSDGTSALAVSPVDSLLCEARLNEGIGTNAKTPLSDAQRGRDIDFDK